MEENLATTGTITKIPTRVLAPKVCVGGGGGGGVL